LFKPDGAKASLVRLLMGDEACEVAKRAAEEEDAE
jgi:hypothetical protein